jgi:hypothetical protein
VTAALVRVHGLVVRTDLRLGSAVGADGAPDVEILAASGGPPGTDGVPDGRVVAELVDEDRRFYTVVRRDAGWVLRFHGLCDFDVDAEAATVRWRAVPGTDDELVAVLATGTVLALVRRLRGECVLHASAVEVDGACWAFFGPSGSGKSTTAALLATVGAGVVADDVLRVATSPPPHALGTSPELRLRTGADVLFDLFPGAPLRRTTADGRTAVRATPADGGRLPLAVLAAPRPVAPDGAVEVRVLDPAEAVVRLTRVDRIARWLDHERAAEHFDFATDLAAQVPVVDLRIPWSRPLRADVALDVKAALRELDGRAVPDRGPG